LLNLNEERFADITSKCNESHASIDQAFAFGPGEKCTKGSGFAIPIPPDEEKICLGEVA
jgi:hypothetical protein